MRVSKAALPAKLLKIERQVLKKLNVKDAGAEVNILSDREMEAVRNTLAARPDFKGREAKKIREEEAVSVLAFPETEGFPNPGPSRKKLGEIYLNYDFAKGDFDLLSYLFIHGLLHLLGYEHAGKRDTIYMEKLEQSLWLHVFSSG